MKDLLNFVKSLLNTMVKGAAALFLLLFLPLLAVAMAAATSLYYCVVTIACFLASLTDDGNLSNFVYPRWSNIRRWIPQLKFD